MVHIWHLDHLSRYGYDGYFRHRLDGPAHIYYNSNGQKESEVWYEYGESHRSVLPDGSTLPALVHYQSNGQKEVEAWRERGLHHRSVNLGPAYIRYHSNGQKAIEKWYYHDVRHRLDGPAIVEYNSNGTMTHELYYLNNNLYPKEVYEVELLRLVQ
jgi:hypothetical protein